MLAQPLSFHRRVEDALAHPARQDAIRRASLHAVQLRNVAMQSLPAADAVRDRARQIRAHTIGHLDKYLDQFVTAAEARGTQVFYAKTAADAVRYVCDLARSAGVRRAVKAKSMISEEIELNHHLEQAGVEVIETDLGEYVVQLAGDRPSHIVAPILHLTREDVARLFREKLGATAEDVASVPNMTALARRLLRNAFLTADLGISGVNFGVAESGTICITTNEGNGRLTTTVPRVHVAMMGIERLVPTAADLTVMLQVLGRSATGQKATVYTNLLTGPRRHGEPDGPDEVHVVLVDNGRSRLLATDIAEILYCIRCGACLNACPVYREIGGHAYGAVYPGPVGSVLTPGLEGIHAFHELPHASSLCGACREICPVRIDIPRMLLRMRAAGVSAGKSPAWIGFGMRAFRWIAISPFRFRLAGTLGARLTRLAARDGWLRRLPGHLAGWTRTRDFPAMAPESFSEQWRRAHARSAKGGSNDA
jgi:L-lactate dehydrogenase complex protein LldF